LPEGTTSLAGNKALVIDTTAPTFPSINVTSGYPTTGNVVYVNLTASEVLGSITVILGNVADHQDLTCYTSDNIGYVCNRTLDGEEQEGSSTVTITGIDSVGNQGVNNTETITTDFSDPSVTAILKSTAGPVKSGDSIWVAFNVSETLGTDPTVMFSNVSMAKGTPVAYDYNYTRTLNGTEVEGTATINISITDQAGKTSFNDSESITTDFTAPIFSNFLKSTSDWTKSGDAIWIAFNVSETLASNPTVTIGGQAMTIGTAGAGYNYNYTRTLNGSETESATSPVNVTGVDLAGNSKTNNTESFKTDFTNPTTPAIITPSDQTIDAANIVVYLDTNSTDTNWDTYQVYSTASQTWTDTTDTNATGFNFTLTQDTNNTLWIRGKDLAGNTGANASTWVLEDSIEPTTSVNNATDGTTTLTTLDGTEYLADTNIIVTATVTESGSGISDVTGYFTTDGSTPTTGSTSFAMTNAATSTGTIPGASISSGQTVKFIVVTTDNAENNYTTGVKSFIVGVSTLSLTDNAWNLVSVPLVLDNNTFTKVFPTTVNKFAWNGSAWSTPTTLTPYNGYWVYNTDGTTIQLDYKVYSTQSPTEESLVAGWNLIGQPFTSTMNVSSALSSLTTKYSHVYEYTPGVGWKMYIRSEGDSGNTVSGRFYQMQTGNGYWIFMTEAATFGGGEMNPVE